MNGLQRRRWRAICAASGWPRSRIRTAALARRILRGKTLDLDMTLGDLVRVMHSIGAKVEIDIAPRRAL